MVVVVEEVTIMTQTQNLMVNKVVLELHQPHQALVRVLALVRAAGTNSVVVPGGHRLWERLQRVEHIILMQIVVELLVEAEAVAEVALAVLLQIIRL
jgi:hypothetical protein